MSRHEGAIAQLKKHAARAAAYSYSPYSQFQVGAAVISEAGKIYGGCNVENASFGLTQCAERSALTAAISDGAAPGSLVTLLDLHSRKHAPSALWCMPAGHARTDGRGLAGGIVLRWR